MRVLVCGGRDYRDYEKVYSVLNSLRSEHGSIHIIEGGAQGADCFAAEWADMMGESHDQHNADWKTHGRSAGPIRNRQMLVEGKPDLIVAFSGGRGTANMIRQAESAGVRVMRPEQNEPEPRN